MKMVSGRTDDILLDIAEHLEVEHERLRSAVVSAAQKWREMIFMEAGTTRSRKALKEAVDALNKFEADRLKEANEVS